MGNKDHEQRARRARSDHAAAAIEALHVAIVSLGRAQYHLTATEVVAGTTVMTRVANATAAAECAHALARILADRMP